MRFDDVQERSLFDKVMYVWQSYAHGCLFTTSVPKYKNFLTNLHILK